MPVSAGLALAEKLAARDGIVAVCIGDGTLGEGVVYETFNIASKWELPLLVVLENNGYAQSTSQAETLAGDICARAAAFGIATAHTDTWDHENLLHELTAAANRARTTCRPMFVRVDTYRLAAHSKGDDDRDRAEIQAYEARDPVKRFLEQARGAAAERRLESIRRRVDEAVARASAARPPSLRARPPRDVDAATHGSDLATTQLDAINRALRAWLASDPSLMILGEDIRSPYGGAFKVTRGLSDEFPDRVLNTPISEAAIVGIGNGLGLGGRRAIVEIMFGDFLGLCFDQLLNHAAKFCGMYNGRVENPLVVRTPMGGGRGYGPTHSQNIEKHFVGIPGLTVIVMHARTRVAELYAGLRRMREPVLVVENKLLYRESYAAPLPPGYSMRHGAGAFGPTLLRHARPADLTVVAFGRLSVLTERAMARLAEEEIYVEAVFPLEVWPLDPAPIVESVGRTRKLLVVEEGASGFDLGSEVIASVTTVQHAEHGVRMRRIGTHPMPIPNALELERTILPSEESIFAACVELFDE
jgi:2-oxoisovalerate dehydrogenase E1 component